MRKKPLLITLFIVLGLSVAYFSGGFVALPIVNGSIFGHRSGENGDGENTVYTKAQADYPLLQEREVHTFLSNNNKLTGYFYNVPNEKGFVLTAHGLNSTADGQCSQFQNWFVEQGYDVFAIDLTGCGQSHGKTMGSLWQSAFDVQAAYRYLKETNILRPHFYMAGHSWGAYGVCASLGLGVKADGVISFAGFDTPGEMMFAAAKRYTGFLADATYPPFWIAENVLYSENINRSAIQAIKDSKTKALLIQGENDAMVTVDVSVYKKGLGVEDVTPLLVQKAKHQGLWRSEAANKYISEVANPIYERVKGDSKKLTKEQVEEVRSQIDLDRSSELSSTVFSTIQAFLN